MNGEGEKGRRGKRAKVVLGWLKREGRKREQRFDSLHPDSHPKRPEPNHRQQAVAQHTSCSIGVYPSFRHQVEKRVDGNCSEKRDGVDVGELRFAGLPREQTGRRTTRR